MLSEKYSTRPKSVFIEANKPWEHCPNAAHDAWSARLTRAREADAREAPPPAVGKSSLRCERDAAETDCRLQCFRELLFSVNFF